MIFHDFHLISGEYRAIFSSQKIFALFWLNISVCFRDHLLSLAERYRYEITLVCRMKSRYYEDNFWVIYNFLIGNLVYFFTGV